MKVNDINQIACIGAGTIGSSWAAYFLMKGFKVKVQEINEKAILNSKQKIFNQLEIMLENKILPRDTLDSFNELITFTDSISEAVKDVQFIQESVFEDYTVKRKVIEEVDMYAEEDTIFASSSSGLLISNLQKFSRYPERIIIGHPFNPPHLIPLVEIVKGNASKNTVKFAYDFYKQIGKIPIIINKEVPGHVANRIQAAVWRECIDLVMNGVCSVKDVDLAISYGPGLRWALLGPHMIFNLGGGEKGIEAFFKQFTPSFETWWRDMADWKEFPPGCQEVIIEGLKEETNTNTINEIYSWLNEKLVSIQTIINNDN